MMGSKAILFNDAMVRAIRDRLKTQTRRPVKPQPTWDVRRIACDWYEPAVIQRGEIVPGPQVYGFADEEYVWISPFGAPGDTLWVRECWRFGVTADSTCCVAYRADGHGRLLLCDNEGEGDPVGIGGKCLPWNPTGVKWRPSIHMPRWACRTNLEVLRVWLEPVQEISRNDAIAEGFERTLALPIDPRDWFRVSWDRIYAGTGFGWDDNPWVWCCEFPMPRG
jgi:hypothetical protein